MVEIRKVREEDLEELAAIAWDTFNMAFRHLNDPRHFDAYMNEAFGDVQIKREVRDSNSLFYLVWQEEKAVGYMKLNRGAAQTEQDIDNAIEIQRIYLAPSLQGQGIGAQLISKAKEVTVEEGCTTLWLGVWEKNPNAIRFYERNGFVVFGEHDFMLGPERQRDILMKQVL